MDEEQKSQDLHVELWIAVIESYHPVSKEERDKAIKNLQPGEGIPGCRITTTELRYLAQGFDDAVRIAKEHLINDDKVVEVKYASHIFGTGDYMVIERPGKKKPEQPSEEQK